MMLYGGCSAGATYRKIRGALEELLMNSTVKVYGGVPFFGTTEMSVH